MSEPTTKSRLREIAITQIRDALLDLQSTNRRLREIAITQIRDALLDLQMSDSGFYEDVAQVALDALDWLEEHTHE